MMRRDIKSHRVGRATLDTGEITTAYRAIVDEFTCAQCGMPTRVASAGWVRRCPECRASHFPRTDPVVIMLVVRGGPPPLRPHPRPALLAPPPPFRTPAPTLHRRPAVRASRPPYPLPSLAGARHARGQRAARPGALRA